MSTPKLWKINLSENFIETFHKDTFIFTQALQVLLQFDISSGAHVTTQNSCQLGTPLFLFCNSAFAG